MKHTSGYIQQSGPFIPCLKAGEHNYTFTPTELSELMNKAFSDGYQFAKSIYYVPETETSKTSWDTIKETNYGTN